MLVGTALRDLTEFTKNESCLSIRPYKSVWTGSLLLSPQKFMYRTVRRPRNSALSLYRVSIGRFTRLQCLFARKESESAYAAPE